jgi:hypothetical protein
MAHKIKSKIMPGKSTYNPALDKFEHIDVFPNKTALIKKKFEGRNLREEIEKVIEKEKITKL